MNKRLSLLISAAAVATAVASTSPSLQAAATGPNVVVTNNPPGLQIVTLRRDVDVDSVVKEYGLTPAHIYRYAIKGFGAAADPATIEKLKQDSRVLAVESDAPVAHCCIGLPQVISTGIGRMGLTNFPLAQINKINEPLNVDVAVLDTGIDAAHPDLYVYQSAGFADPGLNGNDWSGHGTHVAGIIGAIDNIMGVVGVAPGVRLWSVQVLGPTLSSFDTVIAGVDYIAQHADQISVVNASLAPSTYGETILPFIALHEAVSNIVSKGVVFVAAAANNGQDIAGPDGIFGTNPGTGLCDDVVPAALPEVMAVSAMDPLLNKIASFSNFSRINKVPSFVTSPGLGIDVTAPGVNIYSTYSTYPCIDNGYATLSGTSMAAPHVAGLVALYIAANGRATNAAGGYRIRQAIIDNSQPQSAWSGYPNTSGPNGSQEPLATPSTNWIPRPSITGKVMTNGAFHLDFQTVPGYTYTAQYCTSLAASNQWATLLGAVTGMGNSAAVTLADPTPDPSTRFYRVVMLPTPYPVSITNANTWPPGYGYGISQGEPGVVGPCVRFRNPNLFVNGLRSYVTVPNQSPSLYHTNDWWPLDLLGPFTVEFWAKPAQLVSDLFCPACAMDAPQNEANGRNGWVFSQAPDNTWQFRVGGTNGYVATVAGGTVLANAWHHVVGVYDGAAIFLYVNGQLAAGPTAAPGFAPNPIAPLRFGATTMSDRTFDGWLDEVAIYPNALSAGAIAAHYSAVTTNNAGYAAQILADHPLGCWHLDEPAP